jgi:hypothetical protein
MMGETLWIPVTPASYGEPMDTNDISHERWLWFADLAGQPAEVERCDDDDCRECAEATPVGIIEAVRAA